MKRLLRVFFIAGLSGMVALSACSGGSGSTATDTSISISGVADSEKITVVGKPGGSVSMTRSAVLSGATVKAIASDGTSAGTCANTGTDGSYTCSGLSKNVAYVVRIASGNYVIKAVVQVTTSNATANVNPASTAAVLILQTKLSDAAGSTVTLGEENTSFSTAIATVDVSATVTAIIASTNFAAVASAVASAVAANTDTLADATVISLATTVAATTSTTSSTGTVTASSKVAITTDADWVAYQVGAGAYTKASSSDTGTMKNYTVDAVSSTGKFTAALHCGDFQGVIGKHLVQVVAGTPAEYPVINHPCGIKISGTVSGLGTGEGAEISFGNRRTQVAANGAYAIYVKFTGVFDLVAIVDTVGTPTRALIVRNVTVNGNVTQDLNLASTNASMVSLTVHTRTVSNATYSGITLITKNMTFAPISSDSDNSWVALSGGTVSGDLYQVWGANEPGNNTGTDRYKNVSAVTDPGDVTFDASGVTTLTASFSPGVHPTINGLSYTPASTSPAVTQWLIDVDSSQSPALQWSVRITPQYLGTATSFTLPDLAAVNGWNFAWDFAAGAGGDWSVYAEMNSQGWARVRPYSASDTFDDAWFGATYP